MEYNFPDIFFRYYQTHKTCINKSLGPVHLSILSLYAQNALTLNYGKEG